MNMRSSRRRRVKLSPFSQKTKAVRITITPLQRKLRELQKIIPGSDHDMDVDSLFQTTASYISSLETQVSFLRKLSSFYGI